MANEEEMEDFSISDRDYLDAMRPGERTFRRGTKNSQIYGIFNDESDEERPSFSKKSKKNDYTAPVGFVKGGIQGKPDTKEGHDRDEDGDDFVNEKNEAVLEMIGIKGRSGPKPSQRKLFQQKDPSSQQQQRPTPSFNQQKGQTTGGEGMYGIGYKLLKQMGFEEGKGLGKDLQGRAVPVEAQVRKGRGAIGLYGKEHKNEPIRTDASDDEKEEAIFKQKLGQWKRDGKPVEKAPKTKYLYRSSDEIIEEVTKNGLPKMAREYSEISKTKVVDMTGPEQRVLGGYTSLGARKTAEPDELETPAISKDKLHLEKLSYNLDTMVDFCEHEIVQNAKEMSSNRDQIIGLEADVKNYRNKVLKEQQQVEVLAKVLQILEEIEKKNQAGSLDLEFLTGKIETLAKNYHEEYLSCNLANVGLAYLIPLMKQRLSGFWRPFDDDSMDEACQTVFRRWRVILEGYDPVSSRKFKMSSESEGVHMDPYHGLLWHAWMPVFRGLVTQWTCKQADPMVTLLDAWDSLLPKWIMDNIVDQLILPKIEKEVENWNPLTDMVPIHRWIHPWLPRLDVKMESRNIYSMIRQKMASALVAWIPSDQSAKSVLLPWVPVFQKGAMDAFLNKHILPKLEQAVMRWEINPSRQELDVWNWVMNWKDLMPQYSIVKLLVTHFFPRWLQVLVAWLNHTPNYEEIAVWYTSWKRLFPPELASDPQIQEQFTRALDLMNRSLAVGGVDLVAPPVAPPPPAMVPPQPAAFMQANIPQGFRELVEYRCAQQGVLFVPLVNRFQAGRPMFRVGNVQCYFDGQIAVVMLNGRWAPVNDVSQLLDMAVQ